MGYFIRRPKTPLLARLMKNASTAMNSSGSKKASDDQYSAERRKFLLNSGKAAMAAGLLGVMQSCSKVFNGADEYYSEQRSSNNSKTAPRISIIGGGIAGLHAAFILKQKGYTSTVYEASQRTGGRMFSVSNIMGDGLVTEVGGEFIDSIHKDMLNLANYFNLPLLDTRQDNQSELQYQAYYIDGVHYTEQQVIDEFRLYAPLIRRDQQQLSSIITVDQHSDADVMFDNMTIEQYFDRIGLNGWLRKMLDVAYVTEFGRAISEQTALNFLWMISPSVNNNKFDIFGVSDERYKISGGNQRICDELAARLSGQVKLGYELTAIRQFANGTYEITFNVGGSVQRITTDIVLITIPFTTLRNVSVSPSWPDWKRKAIFDIGYGNNSKLMLGFDSRYWYNLGYAGYYFNNSFLQSGWENSALQRPSAGGLTIYSGGQQAIDVGNGTVAQQVAAHLPMLNKMYPGATQHYSGLSSRFVWPTFKWTKASYSCFLPGQYTTIAGNEMKPVGNIFFAGEHCSYNFQGYMNGGAETGRRAAESIIASLR